MSKISLELLVEYIQNHEEMDLDEICEKMNDVEFDEISKAAFYILEKIRK